MRLLSARRAALMIAALGAATTADAQLVNLGPGSFTPLASVITFSEAGHPLGQTNPVYTFLAVPGLGDVTVSFAGAFVGQTVTGGFPATLTGSPTGPLSLAPGTTTNIVNDAAVSTAPVLSGAPLFNGPIAVLFSTPVAAVGLSGGFFNAIGGTTITAFDATGAALGSIVNSALGVEFYGLADASGANVISGIAFYITGPEPAGFGIDNLTFGAAEVVPELPDPQVVPVPAAVWGGMALLGAMGVTKRLRRRSELASDIDA